MAICFFDFFNKGVIQKVRSSWRRWGRGSLKSERKQTGGGGGGQAYLQSVRSLCGKKCLIFKTANRVLSDKLLGIYIYIYIYIYICIYICAIMWAIILNFYQATHVSLIQNESYQQSPEKMKNNG